MKATLTQFGKQFAVMATAFCAAAVFATAVAAWDGPSQNPPNGNPPPPLNTGSAFQEKDGGIGAEWFEADDIEAEFIGAEGVESWDWMYADSWIGTGGGVEAEWIAAWDGICFADEDEWDCRDSWDDVGGGGGDAGQADWLWQGEVGGSGSNWSQNVSLSGSLNGYKAVGFVGAGVQGERNITSIPWNLFDDGNPLCTQTFSGNDSGYVCIKYVNSTTVQASGYRGGRLWLVFGVR